jgi:hypothetical protein
MPNSLAIEVLKVRALLDKIHRHPPTRTGKLKFLNMAEVRESQQSWQDPRHLLKGELRSLGREFHSRGGSLQQRSEAAIRDERDASVLAAAWDGIGGFYR